VQFGRTDNPWDGSGVLGASRQSSEFRYASLHGAIVAEESIHCAVRASALHDGSALALHKLYGDLRSVWLPFEHLRGWNAAPVA